MSSGFGVGDGSCDKRAIRKSPSRALTMTVQGNDRAKSRTKWPLGSQQDYWFKVTEACFTSTRPDRGFRSAGWCTCTTRKPAAHRRWSRSEGCIASYCETTYADSQTWRANPRTPRSSFMTSPRLVLTRSSKICDAALSSFVQRIRTSLSNAWLSVNMPTTKCFSASGTITCVPNPN